MQEKVMEVFVEEFFVYLLVLKILKDVSCLIVGFGNWNVMLDVFGFFVIENFFVMRYLFRFQLENVQEGYRLVSVFVFGVMGLMGIEMSDII